MIWLVQRRPLDFPPPRRPCPLLCFQTTSARRQHGVFCPYVGILTIRFLYTIGVKPTVYKLNVLLLPKMCEPGKSYFLQITEFYKWHAKKCQNYVKFIFLIHPLTQFTPEGVKSVGIMIFRGILNINVLINHSRKTHRLEVQHFKSREVNLKNRSCGYISDFYTCNDKKGFMLKKLSKSISQFNPRPPPWPTHTIRVGSVKHHFWALRDHIKKCSYNQMRKTYRLEV